MAIQIKHELVRHRGKVRFRKFRRGGYENFRVKLYVSGDIDNIKKVEYELHPSFRNSLRVGRDREKGFPIEIWTWGEFEILVTVYYNDGTEEEHTYDLKYSNELPADNSAYFDETKF